MKQLLDRRSVWIVIVLIVTVAVATPAGAYWKSLGTGSSSVKVSTPVPAVVAPGVPVTQLYPGGSSDVALTISNPNPFPIHVTTVDLDSTSGNGGFAADTAHNACVLSALHFTAQTNGGLGWTVPKKVGSTNGALALDLANALTMTTAAASACQGAAVSVYLIAGP